MTNKVEATLQNVKEMQGEIRAWENRLETVRSDVDALNRQKEALKKQVEDTREALKYEVETKLLDVRKRGDAVAEERAKLDADKKEFQAILLDFKKEKLAFDRAKSDVDSKKAEYENMMTRITAFVRMVRQGAESL